MSSDFGKNLRCTVFGQSHSPFIGIVLDGFPAGIALDDYAVKAFMARRAPGGGHGATARTETDEVQIISGLAEGVTCGAPLCAVIANEDANPADYAEIKDVLRPSHGDFTALLKYGEAADRSGGGHFSGRLTAPICFGGAVAKQILAQKNIIIGAHVEAIGNIHDKAFDPVNVTADDLLDPSRYPFPTLNFGVGETMQAKIDLVAKKGDSVGGIIEAAAINLPQGLGDPMFDGIENLLAKNLFGIPAVKGVEFGAGFRAATMTGSQHNDAFTVVDGKIVTTTNHAGGILGGITTGMPLILRVAIKPTPSIPLAQQTVHISDNTPATVEIKGRHDSCIVPRAVPVVESIIALTVLDLMLGKGLI